MIARPLMRLRQRARATCVALLAAVALPLGSLGVVAGIGSPATELSTTAAHDCGSDCEIAPAAGAGYGSPIGDGVTDAPELPAPAVVAPARRMTAQSGTPQPRGDRQPPCLDGPRRPPRTASLDA